MHVRALVLVFSILATSSLLVAQIASDPMQQGMMTPNGGRLDADSSGSISGSLITIDGRPIRDSQVELHDANTGLVIASGYTKVNGSFEFINVPVGHYEVVANKGVDTAHERVRVDHGPAQVTLRISTPQPEPGAGNTVSVAALQVPDKAKDAYRKASELFQKRKYDESEKYADKALALVPTYANALTIRGLLKINRHDDAGGQQDLQQAIKSDPNFALAYFAMGAALNSAGEFSKAQQSLEQGLKIEPTSWQGYFELSKAVMGQHDFRNALKYVVKSESLGGAVYAPMHLVKAHALLGLKDYDEAATELEHYLSQETSGPNADEARRTLSQAKAFSATAQK